MKDLTLLFCHTKAAIIKYYEIKMQTIIPRKNEKTYLTRSFHYVIIASSVNQLLIIFFFAILNFKQSLKFNYIFPKSHLLVLN